MAVVGPVRLVLRPSGGVGGLPVEGFRELSLVVSSRGLRNIALRSGSRHGPVLTGLSGVATSDDEGISRHHFYAWSRDHFIIYRYLHLSLRNENWFNGVCMIIHISELQRKPCPVRLWVSVCIPGEIQVARPGTPNSIPCSNGHTASLSQFYHIPEGPPVIQYTSLPQAMQLQLLPHGPWIPMPKSSPITSFMLLSLSMLVGLLLCDGLVINRSHESWDQVQHTSSCCIL